MSSLLRNTGQKSLTEFEAVLLTEFEAVLFSDCRTENRLRMVI